MPDAPPVTIADLPDKSTLAMTSEAVELKPKGVVNAFIIEPHMPSFVVEN